MNEEDNANDAKFMLDYARKMADLWQSELSNISTNPTYQAGLQQQLAMLQLMMKGMDGYSNDQPQPNGANFNPQQNGANDQPQQNGAKTPDFSLHECLRLYGELSARIARLEQRLDGLEQFAKSQSKSKPKSNGSRHHAGDKT